MRGIGAASARPSAASIASLGIAPWRNRRGSPPRQATIVEFDSGFGRSGVEDQVDAPVEIGQHMRGERRADAAGAVGGGRDERNARRRDQRARDLVARRAATPRCRAPRAPAALTRVCAEAGATRVSGPGQKARASVTRVGVERRLTLGRLDIEHMGDQRIERRPFLGRVDRGDGAFGVASAASP